jgi:hypothetical protein
MDLDGHGTVGNPIIVSRLSLSGGTGAQVVESSGRTVPALQVTMKGASQTLAGGNTLDAHFSSGDKANLDAIFAQWNRTGLRPAQDALTSSTTTDAVTGHRFSNWFFDDADDMILDFLMPYDRKNKIA